jgi:polyisoprenoid-binding protein YceI
MTKRTLLLSLALPLSLSLGLAACKNPADGKTEAKVEEAKPVPGAAPAADPATPAAAPAAGVVKYTIAPDTSKIAAVGSKVTRSHDVTIPKFAGTFEITDGKPETAKGSVEIDMKAVTSDDPKLTGHLQSPDFFDTAKYPTSTFTLTEVKVGGDKGATHTVTGNLELHGVTKSISFPATVAVSADKVDLTSEFVIKRQDFGITYPGMADDLIRDEVVFKLDLHAPVAK